MSDEDQHAVADNPTEALPERASLEVLTSIDSRAARGIARRDARIDKLEEERKHLRAIQQVTAELIECAHDGRWAHAIRRLRRAKKLRDQLTQLNQQGSLDLIEHWLTTEAEQAVNGLTRTLPAALGDETPDPESRFPKFTFRQSFITVEVKKSKFEATVQTRTGKKHQIAADAAEIAEAVHDEIKRCFGRSVDLDDFARRLRSAHSEVVKGGPDTPAPIREVALAVSVETQLDEFSVDLARLVSVEPGTIGSISGMRLNHTKDVDRGLQLPGLEQNGYYGTIQFDAPHAQEETRSDSA